MLIRFTGNRKLDYNLSILSQFDNWSQNLYPDMDTELEILLHFFFLLTEHSEGFVKHGNEKNAHTFKTIYVN